MKGHLALALSCLAPLACRAPSAPARPLDWSLGDWHGVRRAAEDGSEAPIAVRVEALPSGPGQIERLQVDGDGRPYVGFSVRVPGGAAGEWTMLYAGSGRASIGRLVCDVGGGASEWSSITSGPQHGSRFVSERVAPDRWRRTQWVSDDAGVTWRVLFTDELERGAAPAFSSGPP